MDERSNPPVLHPVIADFGLSSMKTQTRTIVPTLGARSVVGAQGGMEVAGHDCVQWLALGTVCSGVG